MHRLPSIRPLLLCAAIIGCACLLPGCAARHCPGDYRGTADTAQAAKALQALRSCPPTLQPVEPRYR
jgi:hypothetical protein